MSYRANKLTSHQTAQSGQLLLEILIAITIAGVILGLGSQTIFLSLRSNKGANDKNVALGLLEETMEAVRNASGEKWQNLFDLTHASNYYPSAPAGKWIINNAGTESPVINNITYTRSFQVRHVCRATTSDRNITGITDSDGSSLTACTLSGGSVDRSTQKVTGNVSWPNASAITSEEYLAGRWRNKACNQTGWTLSGQGTATCGSGNFDTKTNITAGTDLQICSGGC